MKSSKVLGLQLDRLFEDRPVGTEGGLLTCTVLILSAGITGKVLVIGLTYIEVLHILCCT